MNKYWQDTQDYIKKCALVDEILRKNNIKSVLDIGCNVGHITALLGNSGYFATGIDINPPNYAKNCKKRLYGKDKGELFIDNDVDSIAKWFCLWLSQTGIDCRFETSTSHNRDDEPKRFIFTLR